MSSRAKRGICFSVGKKQILQNFPSGTTAVQQEGARAAQLVGLIDPLVRLVIKTDPELLAAWENLVKLPRRRVSSGGVTDKPIIPATTGTPTAASGTATPAPATSTQAAA